MTLMSVKSMKKELSKEDKTFYSQIWGRWFGKTEMGAGMEQRARHHTAKSYVYRNTVRPKFSNSKEFAGTMDIRPEFSKCDHGDCYSFMFGLPFYPDNAQGVVFTEDEKNFSLRMMSNWVEFMKTGNINGWEDFRTTELGFQSVL